MGYKYEKLRNKLGGFGEKTKNKGSNRIVVAVRIEEFIRRGCFVRSLYKELPKVGNPKPTLQIDCEPK